MTIGPQRSGLSIYHRVRRYLTFWRIRCRWTSCSAESWRRGSYLPSDNICIYTPPRNCFIVEVPCIHSSRLSRNGSILCNLASNWVRTQNSLFYFDPGVHLGSHSRHSIDSANRGLGLEFVQELTRTPSNVVIATARNPDQATSLQDIRSKLPQQLHILRLDVTDESSIQQCAKEVEGILGERGLDYLLNNAGVSHLWTCHHWSYSWCSYFVVQALKHDSPLTFKAQDFIDTFKVNVVGPALIFQAFRPIVEKSKRKVIVNISSRLGSVGNTAKQFQHYYTTYSSCKAALNMFVSILFGFYPTWTGCLTEPGQIDSESCMRETRLHSLRSFPWP